MKLVILGLKNKMTGEYKALDVERSRNENTLLRQHTPTKIATLSPFPFEHFSSLTFSGGGEVIGWEPCYLEVEADLDPKKFSSMKSSGIVYHRFENQKVSLIGEFFEPFQYSLSMLKKFKKQLGTYSLTTWVLHNGTGAPGEHEAMIKILESSLERKTKRGPNYGTDISLADDMLEYLSYLLDKKSAGYLLTFGQYGSNSVTQMEFNKVDLTGNQLLQAYSMINCYGEFSVLKHPNFTYNFYLESIKGSDEEEQFLSSLYDRDIEALKENHFPIEKLFKDYFVHAKADLIEYLEYDDDFISIEAHFADKDYLGRQESHSPYDYYCCEDCDGYDIHSMYTDEELEPTITYIDDRVDGLVEKIESWIPYLTKQSKPLFDFIPEDMYPKFKESGLTAAVLR